METTYNNKTYNINAHPYKGLFRLNEEETKKAFFFDARLLPTKPLSAYIIYRDDDNSIHILTGSSNLDEIQKTIEYIDDPTEEEIQNEYVPLLMDYIEQNQLDIPEINNNSYIEDMIVNAIATGKQKRR